MGVLPLMREPAKHGKHVFYVFSVNLGIETSRILTFLRNVKTARRLRNPYLEPGLFISLSGRGVNLLACFTLVLVKLRAKGVSFARSYAPTNADVVCNTALRRLT